MALVVVAAPTDEPLTLDEAKDHLRVSSTDEDAHIEGLIRAARQHAENFSLHAFVTQTWDLVLDRFATCIAVPLPPLQSVTNIKYIDTNGVEQTLASTEYTVDLKSTPGRVVEAFGKCWPSTRGHLNDVTIRFVAGFGNSEVTPDDIKAAMKLILGELYERRENAIVGSIIELVPLSAQYLLRDYRARATRF